MQFFEGDENFSWRVLGVESFVIMLSVLLGFTLNGWRVNQSEQETVDAALRSIAAEMRYNERRLERLLPYYRSMRDTLQHLAAMRGDNAAIEIDTLAAWTGLGVPLLRASSFQTARSTGALNNMDFDLADGLFFMYTFQKFYSDLVDKFTTAMLMNNFNSIEQWHNVFGVLAKQGEELYGFYNELLSVLFEEYSIPAAEAISADSTRAAP